MQSYKSLFELAKKELEKRNHAIHAVQILMELVKSKQDDGLVLFYYGTALQETEQYFEAYKAYQSSAKLLDGNEKGRAYVRLGVLEKLFGRFEESEIYFNQASELSSQPDPSFWVLFGATCLARGKYKEALSHFKRAHDLSKQSTDDIDHNLCDESCLNLGYVYRRLERYPEAIVAFKEALRCNPSYKRAKDELDIMEALEEALDISNKIKNRHYRDDQLEELYLALHHSADENWNPIIIYEALREYLKLKPGNGLAWVWYSKASRDLGRGNEAFEALDKAVKNCPIDLKLKLLPSLDIDRAMLCEIFKTREEAEKWYEIALKKVVNRNTVNWLRRGKNLAILGEFESASQCYEKALKCRPDINYYPLDEVYSEMGIIARSWGKFKKAKNYFEESLEINPENIKAKNALEGLRGIEKTLEKCSQFKKGHPSGGF